MTPLESYFQCGYLYFCWYCPSTVTPNSSLSDDCFFGQCPPGLFTINHVKDGIWQGILLSIITTFQVETLKVGLFTLSPPPATFRIATSFSPHPFLLTYFPGLFVHNLFPTLHGKLFQCWNTFKCLFVVFPGPNTELWHNKHVLIFWYVKKLKLKTHNILGLGLHRTSIKFCSVNNLPYFSH